MQPFVHLHVHSQYSVLDGQASVKALVDKAIANGMRGIALTDHGNMFGIKELTDYVNKKNKDVDGEIKNLKKTIEELKSADAVDQEALSKAETALKEAESKIFTPIIGCEMYVADNDMTDRSNKKDIGRHLIVLAKNQHGYHNLIKLVSNAWTDGYYYHPRTDKKQLEKYHEDLIVCSACLGGEVPKLITAGHIEEAEKSILWFKKVFGEDYYLELQRHKATVARANQEAYPLQQEVNKVLIEMSKKHNIKLVCTNDVHFVNEEDAEAHDRLICVSTGTFLDDDKRMLYTKQEWMKTQEEMNELFADVPEALSNTQEVLGKVERYSIEHGPILPNFPLPEGFTDNNDYLRHLVLVGAEKRWGKNLTDEQKERIDFELDTIKNMGFPGYFLIVQDFIGAAREIGVSVGPGRGSAAGSAVAYCLGITQIDPIKYDLLFERFLNPDRVNLPDIDTDFDDDGRGRVLQWVMDKYGHENCAHIITYASMATKNSIKDVARVEKLPLDISNALCKAIPERLPDGLKMNLTNAIKCTPELREAESSADPRERNTIKYAKMLEGTVRGTGIHACGFIICRNAISDWVPVSTADDPDFKGLKVPVTQYDGHVIESTGLIKMDFLGLKTLSELKEACKVVKQTTGHDIDLDTLPIDDELTYQLYQQGRTIGTFQFESPGMQKHLRNLHPTVFEDLIAMNALYRPGPMDYIPEFIRRKHDPSLVTYDIPCMEKYLKDTYGITVYQEQVMLLSRQLADFTRGESDALRKAMGKKKKDIVDAMKPKFIEGGKKNGHDPKVLEKIWADWEKFASYAFNKSHATCYSWVAYQTAYMKAHYPAEYMAALMTRRFAQITEITKLMEECKAMNIETLGPDVNESFVGFGVNKKGEIRFGLSAIKGMGGAAADAIVNERLKNGPYKDVFDFVMRVSLKDVNRKAIESLALSGGLDCFNIRREDYFGKNSKGDMFLDTLVRFGQNYQLSKAQAVNSLFGEEEVEVTYPPVPKGEEWSTIERLGKEKDLVGIYLSAHPLDDYAVVLKSMCNTHCCELENLDSLMDREEIVVGGIITEVRPSFTKRGEPFGFVTIEDYEGPGKIAIFGEEWGKWNGKFITGSSIYMTCKCFKKFPTSNFISLQIKSIEFMQTVKEKQIEKFTIIADSDKIDEEIATDISTLVEDHPGNVQLYFQITDNEHNSTITLRMPNTGIELSKLFIEYVDNHEDFSYKVN